ncbi:DUF1992 domain-containing protein [Pseudoruegeria sp. HB172150]|uniref:DnaJ family domain-containing protein n=1 Tax=Pseudoruegeria sp. HB172150 TaxID=2721164 RepID=UPI001557D276|nr:DUF1992 domain-containing protein [Pseudoruegeria sp. HB172150]
MSRSFRSLIERQIFKAQAEGQLDNLEGQGKPLPDRSGEAHLDAGEAAAHRMMAEAGALPEEILIKRQVAAQKQVLAGLTDPDERKAAMRKLADLELKLAIAQEARRKFMKY